MVCVTVQGGDPRRHAAATMGNGGQWRAATNDDGQRQTMVNGDEQRRATEKNGPALLDLNHVAGGKGGRRSESRALPVEDLLWPFSVLGSGMEPLGEPGP